MNMGPSENKVNNWPVEAHEIKICITNESVNWVKNQPTEFEKNSRARIETINPKIGYRA